MKLFTNCSGSCETCKIHYIGGCIAGHGDDDYVYASPEWIEEFKKQHKNEDDNSKKESSMKNVKIIINSIMPDDYSESKLIKEITTVINQFGGEVCFSNQYEAKDDVEQIVRCKDCQGILPEGRKKHRCDIYKMFGNPEFYCALGRRKE